MDKIKLAVRKWWATVSTNTKQLLIAAAIGLLVGFILCAASTPAGASERHHYQPSPAAIKKAFNSALPAAAGQHHYKATTQLQWSVGAAFADEGSAVSFGLGQQLGKVFAAGSYSTDGDNSIFNITGSGTF